MKQESIFIYGSFARNETDIFSDKDIIVVKESFEERKTIESEYANAGWSCSVYTYKRLENLCKVKSLFIQHLKQDAICIIDPNHKVRTILEEFSPKESYHSELYQAERFFETLRYIPDSVTGIGWALDILWLALRNYLILHFAQNKRYNFSFPNMLDDLAKQKNLSSTDVEVLLQLRMFKKNYREHINQEPISKDFFNDIIKIINNGFGLNVKADFLSLEMYSGYCLNRIKSDSDLTGYQKLRLFETLVFSNSIPILDSDRAMIENMLDNPKFYVYSFNDQAFVTRILGYKEYEQK